MRKTKFLLLVTFLFLINSLASFELSRISPSDMKLMQVEDLVQAPEELAAALKGYHQTRDFIQSAHDFFQNPDHYINQRIAAIEHLLDKIPASQEWDSLRKQAEYKLAYLKALPDPRNIQATRYDLFPGEAYPMSVVINDSYWFEYLDPLHRIGPEVKVHIDAWLATEVPNYFIFLETVEYDPLLNQFAPFEHQVKYFLNEEERAVHRLSFQNGKAYLEGELFDTGDSFSLHSDEPGLAIFTIGLDEEIYVNSHVKYHIHHSSEFAGGEVLSAGELKAENGIILELSNKSGHYSPKHSEVMLLLEAFHKKLGDLTGIELVMFQYTKEGLKYHKQYATFDAQAYLDSHGQAPALKATGNWTPLHVAVWNNHIQLSGQVLDSNSLNVGDFQGNTPLHLAVFQEHLEWVKTLLNAGVKLKIQNDLGETPLHLACRSGNQEIARLLLKRLDYVDSRNHKEQTPLHYAAQAGSIPIFEALIEKGANPDAFDIDGNHLFNFAVYQGNLSFVKYLLQTNLNSMMTRPNRKNASVLHSAAAFGDQEMLEFVLSYNFDLYQRDYKGRTALHYAARFGNAETASYMISLNDQSLLNAKSHRSLTAFHYAAQHLPLFVIKEFIQAGAKINAVDYKGRSPLFYAITGRSVNSLRNLKYLLCHGAYTHIYSTSGQAAIHYAAARGSVSSVRRILSSSNDLTLTDSQGRTALDIAVEKKYPIMTRYLTDHSE